MNDNDPADHTASSVWKLNLQRPRRLRGRRRRRRAGFRRGSGALHKCFATEIRKCCKLKFNVLN